MVYFITVSETEEHFHRADGVMFCIENFKEALELIEIFISQSKFVTIEPEIKNGKT